MSDFKALNLEYQSVVRDSFDRQPFMALVGATMTEVKPGYCELVVQKRHDLTQQHGFFHGGLVVSLADSAAGYAAYSLFPENSTVLTVDLKTNFLNPSEGGLLHAQANVIGVSDALYHVKADVYSEKAGSRVLCLTGVFTMMCLQGRSDQQQAKRVGA